MLVQYHLISFSDFVLLAQTKVSMGSSCAAMFVFCMAVNIFTIILVMCKALVMKIRRSYVKRNILKAKLKRKVQKS